MPAYIPPSAGIYIEYLDSQPPCASMAPSSHKTPPYRLPHSAHPDVHQPLQISTAKYTFPLYESCLIAAFRCFVGKRLIKGIIKEEDTSATYQASLDRNEPASLLEQYTADVFSTSIGNIPGVCDCQR